MFCLSCGKELPQDAQFCLSCGKPVGTEIKDTINNNLSFARPHSIRLVHAKCTSCGATLEVDPNKSAAICSFCNDAYIVEQAVNNYNVSMQGNLNVNNATINVSGVSVDNLLLRAKDFENKLDFESALSYYNKVLDIDFSRAEAKIGIDRVRDAIENYVYFETIAKKAFSRGVLQLRPEKIVYISNKGKEKVFFLRQITEITRSLMNMQFKYLDAKLTNIVSYETMGFPSTRESREWVTIINNAKEDIYPQ